MPVIILSVFHIRINLASAGHAKG